MSLKNRARGVVAVLGIAPLVLTACYVKDQLLSPQNPGTVSASVRSAACATS
jgi:hypothetical protein